MKQLLVTALTTLFLLLSGSEAVWADDFIVERAVNLGQLDSWADISKFQWEEINYGIHQLRHTRQRCRDGCSQGGLPRPCSEGHRGLL